MSEALKRDLTFTIFLDEGAAYLWKLEVAIPFLSYQMKCLNGQFWSCCLSSGISALTKLGITIDWRNECYTNQDGRRTFYQPYDLLLPEETADVLSVTTGTLAVWRSTGRYPLKFVKIGRYVRYRWSDITAFMDQQTRTQVS